MACIQEDEQAGEHVFQQAFSGLVIQQEQAELIEEVEGFPPIRESFRSFPSCPPTLDLLDREGLGFLLPRARRCLHPGELFEDQAQGAHPEGIRRCDASRRPDALIVDVTPVPGSQILKPDGSVIPEQPRVRSGNGGVLDDDVLVRGPPDLERGRCLREPEGRKAGEADEEIGHIGRSRVAGKPRLAHSPATDSVVE